MKTFPDLSFEDAARARGARVIAGVDEVGRGPLAGPVVAAAVILTGPLPQGINDSKQTTARQRDRLAEWVMEHCIWGQGIADVEEIDRLNIYHASHLAMCRAVERLAQHPRGMLPDHVLVDGNAVPKALQISAEGIIKGDARSLSIAAASIVAKVLRDRIMVDLAQQHPGYGWEKNAGYPTAQHRESIHRLGITLHHRRSFKPIHNILCKGQNPSL